MHDPRMAGARFDSIVLQRQWVTVFHGVAIFAAGLCYWLGHLLPVSTFRGGSIYAVVHSAYGWIPVAMSWVFARNPNETDTSFRFWQVLFVAINLIACFVHLGHSYFKPGWGSMPWSFLHAAALLLILPLVRGRWP
jgi:hypothetical protein